jgi:hypothetical protein
MGKVMGPLLPVIAALWTLGVEAAAISSLNHPGCGQTTVITLRVTRGQNASLGQFPFAASLLYRPVGVVFTPGRHMCGGTLVTDRSAHSAYRQILGCGLPDQTKKDHLSRYMLQHLPM